MNNQNATEQSDLYDYYGSAEKKIKIINNFPEIKVKAEKSRLR